VTQTNHLYRDISNKDCDGNLNLTKIIAISFNKQNINSAYASYKLVNVDVKCANVKTRVNLIKKLHL